MTRIYRETDAEPALLSQRRIAVIGYGNQGRAQALNLRDSGAQVLVGNVDDGYRERAAADGFMVLPIAQAVAGADVVMLLLPDEVLPCVFPRDIAPHLRPGTLVSVASGYNIAFGNLAWPANVDIVLLAPRMVGVAVRERYLAGEGFYSFIAVERDATGSARALLLALCHGIGSLRKGAVEVTCRMEAELDLFNEQAFGPAFGKVLLTAVNTLIEAGYPKEAVLLELYLSGELGCVCRRMAEVGLMRQLNDHSATSQYGAISRGLRFVGIDLAGPMRKILRNIQQGKFAREWSREQWTGKWRYRLLRLLALGQPIGRLEKSVRRRLGMSA